MPVLLDSPIPNPPGPTDSHSPVREGDTIAAIGAVNELLQRVIDALDQFEELEITDASDQPQRLRILAKRIGAGVSTVALHPFELIDTSTFNSDGTLAQAKIRVLTGIIDGTIPDVFNHGDFPPYTFDASGNGEFWGHATFDVDTGVVTDTEVDHGDVTPDSDLSAGDVYMTIGTWSVNDGKLSVANTAYGPIMIQTCPIPYTNPQKWTATLFGNS